MLKKLKLMLVMTLLLGAVSCSKDQKNIEGVEITFWRPQADEIEDKWYLDKVKEFNELNENKIKVNMEVISRGNSFAYEDKINANVVSNTLPDVLSLDGPNVANYAYSELLVPLDDKYNEEELNDFLPSIISQGSYNNKLYAIGLNESSVVLFYNKAILDKLNIDLKNISSLDGALTLEDVYNISKRAKNELDIWGINWINDKGEWMTYCFGQFILSNGKNIISEDGKTSDGYINSKEAIEIAELIQKFSKENLFNIDPLPTEFQLGKSAFMLGGTWNIKGFKDYPELDWGVTYFPYIKEKTSPSGSWALGISKDSKNSMEASEFIKFLTNKENSLDFAQTISMPASRKSALELMEEYNNGDLVVIKNQLEKTAVPRPVIPGYTILTAKFSQALNDIMLGSDPKNSFDKASKEIDSNISKTFK